VAPFFGLLREQAARIGIELVELLRAEDGRYWSYACANPACGPPEGSPYDDTPDTALAALLPEGVPGVLPSREALAGLVAPCGADEAVPVARAVRAAGQRAARLTGRAHQSTDPVARCYPVARAGIRAVRAALRACSDDQAVTRAQVGWLLVTLSDSWGRDDALGRLDPASRRAHLKLWTDLTRLAAPGYVAAPATLLAHAAWRAGNGPLANVALDRALEDDPGYPLARIMHRVLARGTSPAEADPPTPRHVAAFYRTQATGTGRWALHRPPRSRGRLPERLASLEAPMNGRTSTVTASPAPGPAGGMTAAAAVHSEAAGGAGRRPRMRPWPLFTGLGPMGALPTTPGLARAFTALTLGSWDLTGIPDLAETSELIASELSTNVVRPATGEDGSAVYQADGRLTQMWLRLMSDRTQVRIEMWDNLPQSAGVPVLRHPEESEEHGRGLQMVDRLSRDWGWSPVPGMRAKFVWALLDVR
jgi:hypothetical protein